MNISRPKLHEPAGGGWRTRSRVVTAGAVAAGCVAVSGLAAVSAAAAVPSFPDNLVVFPDRDFVTVEGYQDRVGQVGTVTVTRDGVGVIGSARAVVEAGDVAFEVNHPGGYCWGWDETKKANSALPQVTPDIKPGDRVEISFEQGGAAGDTTVGDGYVTEDAAQSGTTVTVKGHLGAGVNPAQLEQRIISPDLRDTTVARRDVRALPGPLTAAPKGGYSSGLEISGDAFTATYVFDTEQEARLAANAPLGERLMSWQVEDADANRQGLTIAEYGEAGGPGMGGCPSGPSGAAPPQGQFSALRPAGSSAIQVRWTPVTATAGTAAVTGYSVIAVADDGDATGRNQVGKRTPATATATTLTLPDAGAYTVEVRSVSGDALGLPFTLATAPAPVTPDDATPPPLSGSPSGGGAADSAVETASVTLSSEAGADLYYTTDGTEPLVGSGPAAVLSDTAVLYTTAVRITAPTLLRAVAFDASNNASVFEGYYKPPALAAPAAPTNLVATAGQESATVTWLATDPSITGYGVQRYTFDGAANAFVKDGAVQATTNKTLVATRLTSGTRYRFDVRAQNAAGYGAASVQSNEVTPAPATDRVVITSARWKARDFRVVGTGSVNGTVVTLRSGSKSGAVLGTATVALNAWEVRLRNGIPATNPGTVYATSSGGGTAGPFSVTNG